MLHHTNLLSLTKKCNEMALVAERGDEEGDFEHLVYKDDVGGLR